MNISAAQNPPNFRNTAETLSVFSGSMEIRPQSNSVWRSALNSSPLLTTFVAEPRYGMTWAASSTSTTAQPLMAQRPP